MLVLCRIQIINELLKGDRDLKKIISFLGTGDYENVTYSYQDINVNTRYVQECISHIVGEDVEFIICLTQLAKTKNWMGKGRDKHTGEEYDRLEFIFIKNNIKYKSIDVFDGHDNSEMWGNFDLIFQELDEDDEIYFDVTHSFRSTPFIVMSVLNYAKFIKNIQIKDIYYGAYEARKDGVAPIFNLSIFNQITDWAIGAEKFLNTGDSKQLSTMIDKTIEPILKETKGKNEDASITRKINKDLEAFSGSLYTVRGNKISEYGTALKNSLELIKEIKIDELKPFEKILEKIYEKVHFYSNDIVTDVHNTVKLCKDLKLIQQAYTFLQENIITYLCLASGIDVLNEVDRFTISKIIPCYCKYPRRELRQEHMSLNEKIKEYINHDLADLYNRIGDYRNDINHAGYRRDAKKSETFTKDLDKFILEFEKLIIKKKVEMEMVD